MVPWMMPGGADIALATCELMKEYPAAVWAHHRKGRRERRSCPLRRTITDKDLRAIAESSGVTLNEAFLDK